MTCKQFHGPETITQILGHQRFAEHLHADERVSTSIRFPSGLAEPIAERRHARRCHDIALTHELPTVVVVVVLDGLVHARQIVASGDGMMAMSAMTVQR